MRKAVDAYLLVLGLPLLFTWLLVTGGMQDRHFKGWRTDL